MLPTKGFWICWFLEIRLHFYWFFIGAAHGGLLLAYAFGGGLFLVLTRVVLPKFGQAILKVVLIIVLSCLLAIFGGWLWLPPAGGCVDGELLVDDGLFAESALWCSRFALLKVQVEVFGRYFEITVFAVLRLHETSPCVLFCLIFLKHSWAMLALGVGMELFLVVFQKVLVVHLTTVGAFDDVSATVAEMRGCFWGRYGLAAVGAVLSLFHNQ